MYKLVKENLRFERKKDPHSAMGIGKQSLIEKWLAEHIITNYEIVNRNNRLEIDTFGKVDLSGIDLVELPNYIQFGIANEFFTLQRSRMVSLVGSPLICYNSFSCSRNFLESLEYMPKIIKGHLYCSNNLKLFNKEYIHSLCEISDYNIFNRT